jgi:hypothetical protein
VRFYDERGGGVETAIKDDKQGLGLTKRSKKRFEAHQMVVMLGTLAHNVIVGARGWLAPHEPKLRRYGLNMSGFLVRNARGHICQIVLNQQAPLVRGLSRSLHVLLCPRHITVSWGQI